MATQRYSVTPHAIDTLMTWIKTGEIAIPEIQRPFVWEATQVRNLLDSLYQGYPVGYLIAWRNPTVKLKDGTLSAGKRILIDGQQRVTALMAALLGREVLTKDYESVRIRIAFHPLEERFEVSNPAIRKDSVWIPDVAEIFAPGALLQVSRSYLKANPSVNEGQLLETIEKLRKIVNNQVGVIELADDLDIETVAEIFIRVNSAGSPLSQADFAMSKIAVNETHGGNALRKAVDYFCHMAVAPDFHKLISKNDTAFANSEYFTAMSWLRRENDDIYDPAYTDMLRVAFTTEFRRGKLQDLVALLSGRNFETKQFEEAIVADSFTRLKSSVLRFMNESHFKRFIMIIRSAGFVDASMIGSQNALNFAYILYLTLRELGMPDNDIDLWVRRWFVFSILTGRYSGGGPESTIDFDIRQLHSQGVAQYAGALFTGELGPAFWDAALPQEMDTSASSSPYFRLFQAAQVKANDKGFLSRDITVRELIEVKSDVHHIFPRDYLKKNGMTRGQYNQIANYVVAQSEINIAIGKKEPGVYFGQLAEQCSGGKKRYGNIVDSADLKANFAANCIPEGLQEMGCEQYNEFLATRRKLMARKIKQYFESL